jgi:cyclic pyranopterin phosphate synthase
MIDLSFAYEIVRWLSEEHGIRHLRLTGGEPLLYPGLLPLLKRLATLSSLDDISLTTNGQALAHLARPLRDVGLVRVNVSLDSLDARQFAHITRGGSLAHTLAGIEAAVEVGLTPVKINVIAQRRLNEQELADIAKWGLDRGCIVRFLEVMPIGPLAHVVEEHLVPADEIIERLSEHFTLRPMAQRAGQPAVDYAAEREGMCGVIGIIAPTTRPFCSRCRRLRVTSQGMLVACLHDNRHFDLKPWWNGHALAIAGADAALRATVAGKPAVGSRSQSLTMLSLGG